MMTLFLVMIIFFMLKYQKLHLQAINHCLFNEEIIYRIFDLIYRTTNMQSQVLYIIICPITYTILVRVEVIFIGHTNKTLFQDVYNVCMRKNNKIMMYVRHFCKTSSGSSLMINIY